MGGTDLQIEPVTRDFIDDDRGDWIETGTLQPQIHHAVFVRRGEWFADVDAGSDLHTIPGKASEANALRLRDAYERLLRAFVEAGLAEDLRIGIVRVAPGHFVLEASLRDLQHGDLDLTPLLTSSTEGRR